MRIKSLFVQVTKKKKNQLLLMNVTILIEFSKHWTTHKWSKRKKNILDVTHKMRNRLMRNIFKWTIYSAEIIQ